MTKELMPEEIWVRADDASKGRTGTFCDVDDGGVKYTRADLTKCPAVDGKFKLGDYVRKIKGSAWHGKIVGSYSTELTKVGYAVESHTEKGSVQIYPEAALEVWEPPVMDVDDLANFIRAVNGGNSLGAGALAENIIDHLKEKGLL